jgi:hypothetical protein
MNCADDLTHSDKVAVGLQHYIPVQVSLGRFKAFPFFLREVDSHITKCHWPLKTTVKLKETG